MVFVCCLVKFSKFGQLRRGRLNSVKYTRAVRLGSMARPIELSQAVAYLRQPWYRSNRFVATDAFGCNRDCLPCNATPTSFGQKSIEFVAAAARYAFACLIFCTFCYLISARNSLNVRMKGSKDGVVVLCPTSLWPEPISLITVVSVGTRSQLKASGFFGSIGTQILPVFGWMHQGDLSK